MRNALLAIAATFVLSIPTPVRAGSAMAKLSSVNDGNTIIVDYRGAEMKIRMHGIAVPPADEARPILQRLNKESALFLKKYLSDGWVYLEFLDDKKTPDADGYVSAYVYRGKDAAFLNEKLVSGGLAIVNRKEKNSFTDTWLKLQETAQAGERGIWGSFENGGGEQIASGVGQATYIGVPGSQGSRRTYVTYWIFLYR
jgi:endonuclease YncB( thermonuclease family)